MSNIQINTDDDMNAILGFITDASNFADASGEQSAPQSGEQSAPQSSGQSAPQSSGQSAPQSGEQSISQNKVYQKLNEAVQPEQSKSKPEESNFSKYFCIFLILIIIGLFLYYKFRK